MKVAVTTSYGSRTHRAEPLRPRLTGFEPQVADDVDGAVDQLDSVIAAAHGEIVFGPVEQPARQPWWRRDSFVFGRGPFEPRHRLLVAPERRGQEPEVACR